MVAEIGKTCAYATHKSKAVQKHMHNILDDPSMSRLPGKVQSAQPQ